MGRYSPLEEQILREVAEELHTYNTASSEGEPSMLAAELMVLKAELRRERDAVKFLTDAVNGLKAVLKALVAASDDEVLVISSREIIELRGKELVISNVTDEEDPNAFFTVLGIRRRK